MPASRHALSKHTLKSAKPENLKRLARYLHLKHIDTMSHRQLSKLIHWLMTRSDKRSRGLTTWDL